MSQKRKVQRARHAAQEEQKGKSRVKWIFGALIMLAIIYCIWTFWMMS